MKKVLLLIICSIFLFSCTAENTVVQENDRKSLFPVKVDGESKFIDSEGNVVFDFSESPANMDFFYPSEGLIGFKEGRLKGYSDYEYNTVIESKYDLVGPFLDGLALVRIKQDGKTKHGFINKVGEWIIKPQFDKAKQFSEGLALVVINKKIGYINRHGDFVIAPQYDPPRNLEFANFKEGFALVLKDNKYTYIDKSGNILTQLEVDFARPFQDGRAVFFRKSIENLDEVGFIGTNGKIAIKPIYAWASDFSDGYAPVYFGDNYGPMNPGHNDMYYIDKSGNKAFGKEFYSCGKFSEGLAEVQIDDGTGHIEKFIIDTTGNIVFKLPIVISEISPYRSGLAEIRIESILDAKDNQIEPMKTGYINREGIIVWEPSY